jgi:hypothetical protein
MDQIGIFLFLFCPCVYPATSNADIKRTCFSSLVIDSEGQMEKSFSYQRLIWSLVTSMLFGGPSGG